MISISLPKPPRKGTLAFWIFQTPVGLAFAGTQAVIIFFALSGFVLTLPALNPGFDWVAYATRRFVRIWVPAAASIVLATVLVLTTSQVTIDGTSGWLQLASTPQVNWPDVFSAFDLIGGSTRINNPLWTMHWELLFSISLAIFLVIGIRLGQWGLLAGTIGLTLLASIGGGINNGPMLFLPPFVGGLILAISYGEKKTVARGFVSELLLFSLGVTLMGLLVFTRGLYGYSQFSAGAGWLQGLWVPGSMLIVRAAILFNPLRSFLTIKPILWLGRISFSLYLVHVPVLVGVQHIFGHGTSLWGVVIALPLCIVVAAVFSRFIEEPTIRLARWTGAKGSALAADQWNRLLPSKETKFDSEIDKGATGP